MKKQKATVTQQQRKPAWRHLISVSSLPQLVEILTFGLKEHWFLQMLSVNQPQLLVKVWRLLNKCLQCLCQQQGSPRSRESVKEQTEQSLVKWECTRESQTSPPTHPLLTIKKNSCGKKGGRKPKLCSGGGSCWHRQTRSPWGIFSVADLPTGVCLGLIGFFSNDLWKIFKPLGSCSQSVCVCASVCVWERERLREHFYLEFEIWFLTSRL